LRLLHVVCIAASDNSTVCNHLCAACLCPRLLAQELLAAKHPTAWVEFEKDQITQQQLFDKFFADGRQFDGQALIEHMVSSSQLFATQLHTCTHAQQQSYQHTQLPSERLLQQ
jgi:hypothetical protein